MRPDWDSYFMKIAAAVSERSTCDRALVGCVLVLDKRILTTGFNLILAPAPCFFIEPIERAGIRSNPENAGIIIIDGGHASLAQAVRILRIVRVIEKLFIVRRHGVYALLRANPERA